MTGAPITTPQVQPLIPKKVDSRKRKSAPKKAGKR